MTKKIIVQKFGGTSVASIERLQHVADIVLATIAQGNQVIVVLSAMSGETDRLINLAKAAAEEPDPREYDALISLGEEVTIALLSILLKGRGQAARSFTGKNAGIETDNIHKKAHIENIQTQAIREALMTGCVPVVAGFQGVNRKGDVTTLGRGGSDTTAVALAAVLKADECQIYTDVDGVYTADPRVVPAARRLDTITLEEMLEMASLGAKVLQNRSVIFAGNYKVPLRVLSSFIEGPGTLITYEEVNMEKPVVSGIAFNRSEAKLTLFAVPNGPGMIAKVLGPIAETNIDVDMILQNQNPGIEGTFNITFTVHRDDYLRARQILEKVSQLLGAGEINGDNKIAKVSVIGVGMRSHAGVANIVFTTLGNEGIAVQLVTTSEIKVSVVIDEKYLELAARSLHTVFGLDREPHEEFDPIPAAAK
jgi:aspartate kinase